MTFLEWHSPTWRKRFWSVAAVLLFVALASHPELRLLLLLLDVVGAELFIALLGFQFRTFFASALVPLFYLSWRILVPAIAAANHATRSLFPLRLLRDFARYALFNWADFGPQTWHSLHKLLRAAEDGPKDGRDPGSRGLVGG